MQKAIHQFLQVVLTASTWLKRTGGRQPLHLQHHLRVSQAMASTAMPSFPALVQATQGCSTTSQRRKQCAHREAGCPALKLADPIGQRGQRAQHLHSTAQHIVMDGGVGRDVGRVVLGMPLPMLGLYGTSWQDCQPNGSKANRLLAVHAPCRGR